MKSGEDSVVVSNEVGREDLSEGVASKQRHGKGD